MSGTGRVRVGGGRGDGTPTFIEHRSLLFTIAYEITGSRLDAEDVVQETWLRWADVDHDAIVSPRAYLAQITTRQALNSVRGKARRREDYVGPWLPEPLPTYPDIADDAVLADAVSMAMLVVLQSLSPDERAVFVLREVFDFSHDEIAAMLGRSMSSTRQIAHRARSHVRSRRPRYEPPAAAVQEVLERFFTATATGNVTALLELLAPDAVVISDGGGLKSAALRPVTGADRVSRLLIGLARKGGSGGTVEAAAVNGMPGALLFLDGGLDSVIAFELRGSLIAAIFLVRNPEKLTAWGRRQDLAR